MTNTTSSCELICLQKSHDAIQLPDGVKVVIGRSPQTKITDPRCSRNQLEVTADWKTRTVKVRQTGSNPSAIDGTDIGPNCVTTLTVDSTLFILSSLYPHKVVFQFQPLQHCNTEKQVNNSHLGVTKENKIENAKKKIVPHSSSSSTEKKQTENKTNDIHSKLKDSKTTQESKTSSSGVESKISSKRPSTDFNEQPVKKKMKTEHTVHSKASVSRNRQHDKSHASLKHNSGYEFSSVNKDNLDSSSKSKITNHVSDTIDGNNDIELEEDDDKHLADLESKLTKMKQDALREQANVCDKNSSKSQQSTAATHSSTSKLKTSSQSSASKLKTSSQSSASKLKTSSQSSASTLKTSSQSSASTLKTSSESSSSNVKISSSHPDKKIPPAAVSDKSSWDYNVDHYVFTSKGVVPSCKIAGFDLDGTIIVTKSGKTFPEDSDDWKINMPEIFLKLKYLHANKFKIVFFTNQLGVSRGKTKIEDLMKKVQNVIVKLQVPIQVFIATHEGRYRKPMTGMWEKLVHNYNSGMNIDLEASIYVGDAAGRQVNWAPKKKKDFSCSDRLFALNIGISFKTPEEFFLNQKPTTLFKMPEFDPRKLSPDTKLLSGGSKLLSSCKETIILVGFPASGKSYFAKNILAPKGYTVINRDNLGSWQKCVKRAQEALVNSSIVIDNTNLSREERARYVECAKKANVPCRCFVFTTTVDHCRHNEKFRQMTEKSHDKINDMIFNQVKKKFEEPSMTEHFTEIVNVNFVPSFSSAKSEADYRKFLLEK